MPTVRTAARFLRFLPCAALLQACAAKSTDVTPVAPPAEAVAAEPQRDTAAAQPPGPQFQPSAPNEIVSERAQLERRRAVGDLVRTGLATTVEQGPPGVLRIGVGRSFHSHPARQYYFTQLESAYHGWAIDQQPLVIELWEGGKKIGEYTERAFSIGPSYTTPRDCPDSATTGLCSSLGQVPPAATAQGPDAVPPAAPPASTRKVIDRSGFNFGLGLGSGTMDFACHGCDSLTSQTGLSGFVSIAASAGEKTLVGLEGTGWAKNQSGATPRVYSLTAHVTEYWNTRSGLFLRAGLGLVGYHEGNDSGDRSASAFGFSGRLGYEVGVGGFAVVPYLGLVRTFGGADMKVDGEDAALNVAISNVQFGLSVAAH